MLALAGWFCWPWFALVVWCMLVLVGQIFQAVAGASMSIGGEGGSDGASSSALTWRMLVVELFLIGVVFFLFFITVALRDIKSMKAFWGHFFAPRFCSFFLVGGHQS